MRRGFLQQKVGGNALYALRITTPLPRQLPPDKLQLLLQLAHPFPTAIKLSGDSVNHVGWAVPTIRMRLWWARPPLPLIPLT
ncbi:MAG: hypothetical protein A2075_06930 [Geobacteraceae bacterium GWC2_58_44]|nr:MAG: hypothetical protein A2075_06930 [Geobacteraceae bacterium GWC2_58_44]